MKNSHLNSHYSCYICSEYVDTYVQPEYQDFKAAPVVFGSDAAVPPWVGYNEEETIQQQILALSAVSHRKIKWIFIMGDVLFEMASVSHSKIYNESHCHNIIVTYVL